MDQLGPESAKARFRPVVDEDRPTWAKLDAESVPVGPVSTGDGRTSTDFGRIQPGVGQSWADLGPNLGRVQLYVFGRFRRLSATDGTSNQRRGHVRYAEPAPHRGECRTGPGTPISAGEHRTLPPCPQAIRRNVEPAVGSRRQSCIEAGFPGDVWADAGTSPPSFRRLSSQQGRPLTSGPFEHWPSFGRGFPNSSVARQPPLWADKSGTAERRMTWDLLLTHRSRSRLSGSRFLRTSRPSSVKGASRGPKVPMVLTSVLSISAQVAAGRRHSELVVARSAFSLPIFERSGYQAPPLSGHAPATQWP